MSVRRRIGLAGASLLALVGTASFAAAQSTATPTPTPSPTFTCVPLETATGTPSPSRTPTPTPTLDHFHCYEIHRPPEGIEGVRLDDQFGESTVDVGRAKRLCLPANKNYENPSAPFHPDHLTAYTIHQTDPPRIKVRKQIIENQFGRIIVDFRRADELLVPTAKSLIAPPPLPANAAIDHFKCYRARGARFRRSAVHLADQFGPLTVDVKRPLRLCAPADKNGEGVLDPVSHLLCYQVRVTRGTPPPLPPPVYTSNQFGDDQYPVFGSRELCVPSVKPVDLDVDTDRDGAIDDDDDDEEDQFTHLRGAVLLVNLDDDDVDDDRDAENDTVDANDTSDITKLDVRRSGLQQVPMTIEYVLRMKAEVAESRARILDGRGVGAQEILGPTEGTVVGPYKEVEISAAMVGVGTLLYGLEGITYPQRNSANLADPDTNFDGIVDVELIRRDAGGTIQAADVVRLHASPWMMLGHLQANDRVYVTHLNGADGAPPNNQFVTDLQTILNAIPNGPVLVQANGANYLDPPDNRGRIFQDPWMQDEIEIGFTDAPGGPFAAMHSVFDGPRGGGLNGYPTDELLGTDIAVFEAGPLVTVPGPDLLTTTANSLDSFGNLEVTPPLTAEGKDWLVGRIYYGGRPGGCQGGPFNGIPCNHELDCPNGLGGLARCNFQMQPQVRDFLAAQVIQGPVELDSDWLHVGHVDEFISFVPFPNAAANDKAFKVLIASPALAIAILEAESAAGRGGFVIEKMSTPPHPITGLRARRVTVDDLITSYKLQNTTRWQPAIDAVKCVMRQRFGLVNADFIDIPVLFHDLQAAGDRRAVARLPDMVNLVVANGHLIVPEPFYDPFKNDFDTKLAAVGYQTPAAANPTIHYLDDFINYHTAEGEVHCGTNSQRSIPAGPGWWTQP